MSRIILLLTVFVHVYEISGQSGGISSKLDFGNGSFPNNQHESTLSTSLIKALIQLQQPSATAPTVISSKLHPNPFNLETVAQVDIKSQAKPDFAGLGVLCVDSTCNVANKKTPGQITDILVQVSTNLKDDNVKSDVPLTNSDVPVIIGNAGTNIDGNERNQRRGSSIPFDTNIIGRRNSVVYHQVPYFQPSYNNHHFGEEPAPQYFWRKSVYQPVYNPQSFHISANNLKPAISWRVRNPSTQHVHSGRTSTTCTCNKPGINWYPSAKPIGTTKNPLISDKLGDL